EAVRLGLVAFAYERRRRDRFREGVHALKTIAVVRHHFAGAPEIIQGQRAVLTAAITLGACARRHLEVAVGHRATLAQDGPHFVDGLGVITSHTANARVAIVALALAAHDHAPVRQLVHRPDGQPAP